MRSPCRMRGPLRIDRPEPLTRLRFAKPPSPTRGEGKNVTFSLFEKLSSARADFHNSRAPFRRVLCLDTAGGAGGIVFGGICWDRQLALPVHRLNPFDFTCEKRSHRSRLTLSAILALY